MEEQSKTCQLNIHRCQATRADRTISIAAAGCTPRPTTTAAASTSEHAAMNPDPRSGVQLGLPDRPAA